MDNNYKLPQHRITRNHGTNMSFRTIELPPVAPFAPDSRSLCITGTLGCSFTDAGRYRRTASRYLNAHPVDSPRDRSWRLLMRVYGDLKSQVHSTNLDEVAHEETRNLAGDTRNVC